MCIPSKFNVLYLLVVLMSIEQGVSASKLGDVPPDLCKNKDRDDFELKLRATLLFRNTLILIDDDWLVYKIPHSNINNSYSQLLIDVLGKPLEEEWPAFKDDTKANWTRIKPNVVSIHHVDIKIPLLYMVAKGMKGVCYNMDTSKFCDGKPVSNEHMRIITDNGPTQFIIDVNNESCFFEKCLYLAYANITWRENGTQGDTTSLAMGNMYYTWNRTTPDLKNITVIGERAYDPSEEISSDFKLQNLLDELEWNLPPGFLYEGDFHFFGHKSVYSFSISPLKLVVYDNEQSIRASNPVKITKVKDYFHCVQLNISAKTFPPVPYTLNPGTADSSGIASWIWIVVGVTVLLLIVAIIALLVWYFSLGSKSGQSKPKGKTSSEAHSKHARGTTVTEKQSLSVKDKKK